MSCWIQSQRWNLCLLDDSDKTEKDRNFLCWVVRILLRLRLFFCLIRVCLATFLFGEVKIWETLEDVSKKRIRKKLEREGEKEMSFWSFPRVGLASLNSDARIHKRDRFFFEKIDWIFFLFSPRKKNQCFFLFFFVPLCNGSGFVTFLTDPVSFRENIVSVNKRPNGPSRFSGP